jgi:GNAT superfamily N-acetyltransferase
MSVDVKLLREYIKESLLTEGIDFHELDSPLRYSKSGNVKRLAYCDSNVSEPPASRDAYFKEYQEMQSYGKNGRRLKKARKGELIPGVSNVCIIGFLDFHEYGNGWYIDYMKTRGDASGQGVASKLMDEFFARYAKPGGIIHFGKMMAPSIGHLKDKMEKQHPDVTVIGAKNF